MMFSAKKVGKRALQIDGARDQRQICHRHHGTEFAKTRM
jgi:hypothetical protein